MRLGCGAHVKGLHRRAAGPYYESDMIDLEALRQIDISRALMPCCSLWPVR